MAYLCYELEPIGVNGAREAVAEHIFCSPECRAKCTDCDHVSDCEGEPNMDGLVCETCSKPLPITEYTLTPEQQAYCDGWNAVMAGADPRFCNPHPLATATVLHTAWCAGALDAFEAEDDDEPEPECAGF